MPFRSKAQQDAMYAAADGNSSIGIPQSAAQRFIAHSAGEDTGGLPQRVPKKPAKSKKRRLKAKRKPTFPKGL